MSTFELPVLPVVAYFTLYRDYKAETSNGFISPDVCGLGGDCVRVNSAA